MKPPYEITPEILQKISSISEKLGEVKAYYPGKPLPGLRKQNRIRTIHATLQIEGNSLTREQVTALMDSKRVAGSQKEIREVQNATEVYEGLKTYRSTSQQDFLAAHKRMMRGLVQTPGRYRFTSAGIIHGSRMAHIAPPASNVATLMNELFKYLKLSRDHALIKSCVFHYELEFIHPFEDGNGRMGRLWQTALMLAEYPVFEFLPFETLIRQNQDAYYKALAISDQQGNSTAFIHFMLQIINDSLEDFLAINRHPLGADERLEYFNSLGSQTFSRKDYMKIFKNISPATASRDLQKGVESGLLEKTGEKNRTLYKWQNL